MVVKPMAVALVHHPVYDRAGQVIATNITNFDIHDIARACRVYNIEKYYIVHPMKEQQMFVSRVLDHWRVGSGSKFNPKRASALTMVEPASSVQEAFDDWARPEALFVSTSARDTPEFPGIQFRKLREMRAEHPLFLVFGTGWGLTEEVLGQCTHLLEPIRGAGPEDYRHLSVRSAVSICLDRLCGSW